MYLAAAIAYSRVYLGVHYVGDVFFGAMLGLGIAQGLMLMYRRWLLPRME
jgi:membrane-associated phospholipid phosphatase